MGRKWERGKWQYAKELECQAEKSGSYHESSKESLEFEKRKMTWLDFHFKKSVRKLIFLLPNNPVDQIPFGKEWYTLPFKSSTLLRVEEGIPHPEYVYRYQIQADCPEQREMSGHPNWVKQTSVNISFVFWNYFFWANSYQYIRRWYIPIDV